MHSPWGFLYQIVKETGWSWHMVLWKVNTSNLMLMMADRPNFKYPKKDEAIAQSGADLARRIKQKQQTGGKV